MKLPLQTPHGRPINYTLYGNLIQRFTNLHLPNQAKQLHAILILTSTTFNNYLASKLISFYSKTQNLKSAHHLFDKIPQKNTFSYNALLIAYSVHNRHADTINLFKSSLSWINTRPDWTDVKPDSFTLSCVLKSVSEVSIDGGVTCRILHCYVVKIGIGINVFVGNGLITCYSRCGDLVSARKVFDGMLEKDLVSWNAMMSGYSQGRFYEECKGLYRVMLGMRDLRMDNVTGVSVLHACAQSCDLVLGMEVHRCLRENGVRMDLSLRNAIVAVYAKCGSLDYARELFEEMGEKDEITYSTIVSGYMVHGFVEEGMEIFGKMRDPGLSTWNAVISGCVQNNCYDRVLDLFRRMQVVGLKPNSVTLSSVLPAIPCVSHLKAGKEIHAYAIKVKSDTNIYVVTAIMDTYAKLGFLDGARRVFNLMKDRSVVVWTSIISAYAAHGDADVALGLFNEMLGSKTMPDAVTLTAVLSACAHAGLVDEAREIFHDLLPKYGINPLDKHYACVVACLSRAGKLCEAVDFVKKMPVEATGQVWGALLSGASEFGDIELAEFVCEHLFELEPENPSNYVCMANMYSKAGRWEEAERIRGKMKNIGFKKVAGRSRIEMPGGLQGFDLDRTTSPI